MELFDQSVQAKKKKKKPNSVLYVGAGTLKTKGIKG